MSDGPQLFVQRASCIGCEHLAPCTPEKALCKLTGLATLALLAPSWCPRHEDVKQRFVDSIKARFLDELVEDFKRIGMETDNEDTRKTLCHVVERFQILRRGLCDDPTPPKSFPVAFPRAFASQLTRMGCPTSLPFGMLVPFAVTIQQDFNNNSLEKIAEWGGLFPSQIIAAMNGRTTGEQLSLCNEVECGHLLIDALKAFNHNQAR